MEILKRIQLQCCFQDWMNQQHEDLEELLQALTNNLDNEDLCLLADKGIKRFEEYLGNRALLSQHDASSFLSPSWCTSFESAFLWIGGCRPSLSIRLVYSLCGSELDESQPAQSLVGESKNTLEDESQPAKSLEGENKGNPRDLSADQLYSINILDRKAVKEEEKLSGKMASLQENIADDTLALIANNSSQVGEMSEDVDQALRAHSLALANILVDADNLRLSVLKELMRILTPLQSIDLLVATKKLHISMHEWGKRRNQQIGKTTQN